MTEVNRAIKAMKRLHYEPSSIRPMKPQTFNKESEILRSSRSRNAMCKTTEKSCIASKNKLSLLAGKYCAFKRDQEKKSKNKLSLLAGKLSLEKKSLRFWMVSCIESKIY